MPDYSYLSRTKPLDYQEELQNLLDYGDEWKKYLAELQGKADAAKSTMSWDRDQKPAYDVTPPEPEPEPAPLEAPTEPVPEPSLLTPEDVIPVEGEQPRRFPAGATGSWFGPEDIPIPQRVIPPQAEPAPQATAEQLTAADELTRLLTPEDVVIPEQIVERPPGEPRPERTWWEEIDRATRPVRFAGRQIAHTPGALLYGPLAAVAEGVAQIEEQTPTDDVPRSARRGPEGPFQAERSEVPRAVADWLKTAATGAKTFSEQVTGTEGLKPETPVEHVGEWAGQYLFPYRTAAKYLPEMTLPVIESKSYTVPLTASAVAARGGLTAFGPEDVPSMIGTAEAQGFGVSPTAKGWPGGTPAPVAPKAGAPTVWPTPVAPGATVVKPAEPERLPGETKTQARDRAKAEQAANPGVYVPPPDQRVTLSPENIMKRRRKKNGDWAETEEQFAKRVEDAWVIREAKARTFTPSFTETVRAINGLEKIGDTEFRAISYTGAALIGMAVAPKFYAKFLKAEVPSWTARSVDQAAPGTVAITVPKDVARMADDVIAPLQSVATRAGMSQDAADKVLTVQRIQTRNGARALADSGISEGRIETPSFVFRAPVSIDDAARTALPASDDYLKMLHIEDELRAQRTQPAGFGAVESRVTYTPPPQYEGMTLDQVRQRRQEIEAANPGIENSAKANQEWNKGHRDFLERGEYSTLTPAERAALDANHPNLIEGMSHTTPALQSQRDAFRASVKERLDNEAKGMYIDEVRKIPPSDKLPGGGESLFTKITKEEYDAHPEWHPNTVTFKRRGVKEYYTTDPLIADAMRADHHLVSNYNVMHMTKRWLETTTTGVLAPHFAPTSAIRSYWIAKFTTERGFKAPTLIGSAIAIPQQLLPQIARSVSRGLEAGSQGKLRELFGEQASTFMDSLSKRLAVAYEESLYAQLKAAGSHRGSILEQQLRAKGLATATNKINAIVAADPTGGLRGIQHFWNAWKASLESVHNGVGFNFVKRNLGKEGLPELALRARRLTGDPRAGGAVFVGQGRQARPIRFESDNKVDQAVANALIYGYGFSAEAARQAIPWWNATLQGIKRIGEAYAHDPIRFARSTALYAMMPAASMFYYAKYLDLDENGNFKGDPNGRSYLDYMLYGRSAYNRQMNFYVPLYGRPVEDGVEITFFHELNPFKRATEIALHHMLGRNAPDDKTRQAFFFTMPPGEHNRTKRNTLKEDFWTAAHMFLETAATPPTPPIVASLAGALGVRVPQGIFGGEAYPIKGDPFNQNGGMPNSLEAATRALFGGISDSLGGFYAAASQTEDGYVNAVKNGFRQVWDVNAKKTPILRDISGILPDTSNNTDLAKDVFAHQREINQLSRFFKKWTINEGRINVKPPSKGGGLAVQTEYGLTPFNEGNPGLPQPAPTNPLYIQFMGEFYKAFHKESPNFVKGKDEGGVGFKSLWANYGDATAKLADLKDVNHGTYGRWQRALEETPVGVRAKIELEDAGVDITDRRAVVNYYRRKQFEALRVIHYVRKAVEKRFTESEWNRVNNGGKPVTLKTIRPYLEADLGPAEPLISRPSWLGAEDITSFMYPPGQ
jgi:hypothetical protein